MRRPNGRLVLCCSWSKVMMQFNIDTYNLRATIKETFDDSIDMLDSTHLVDDLLAYVVDKIQDLPLSIINTSPNIELKYPDNLPVLVSHLYAYEYEFYLNELFDDYLDSLHTSDQVSTIGKTMLDVTNLLIMSVISNLERNKATHTHPLDEFVLVYPTLSNPDMLTICYTLTTRRGFTLHHYLRLHDEK